MRSVSARPWRPPSSPSSGSEYLPAIDGLRALAVIAVVAYHLGLPWARGGFLGVDLFFVLSGFLITGLLLREREQTGRIDLGHFYARRARRLLPALFLVLAAVSTWVAATGTTPDLTSVRSDALAALAYVANWRLVLSHSGYFAQFSAPSPLRHAWSLAIEEQYYLVWPILLLGLMRLGRGSRRATVLATLVLAVLSASAMAVMYHPGADPSRIYYGTDTRAFELLVGALLALLTTARPASGAVRRAVPRAVALVGPLALATLVVACLTVHDDAGWMYH
ncbi:MAG TPA: acyltransferase, partial [Acidimicrobiales bacterium]|nr:acyltransferase [Acidimicrobiales bacterium]